MLHVYEPGNGTRYEIAIVEMQGLKLLCLVNFGTCMKWHGMPGEAGYIAEKLQIPYVDAQAVYTFMLETTRDAYEAAHARLWSSLIEAREAGDAEHEAHCQARLQKVQAKLSALQALADL